MTDEATGGRDVFGRSRKVPRYVDRADAGRQLAPRVAGLRLVDPLVLALPRGGVPVAYEVARALGAPLDVFVARKVGAPGRPELGIGAVAEGSASLVVTGDAAAVVDDEVFVALAERVRVEVERRVATYRGGRALPAIEGREVVVVDDGLATGITAEAAVTALAARSPRRLVLAVPVGAAESVRALRRLADDVVCPAVPDGFRAVGQFYDEFAPTTDEEVLDLLGAHRARRSAAPGLGSLDAGGRRR